MKDDIFKIIEAIPDIPKDETGVYHYGKCTCGGTITAIRSVNDGHLYAKCDKLGNECEICHFDDFWNKEYKTCFKMIEELQ